MQGCIQTIDKGRGPPGFLQNEEPYVQAEWKARGSREWLGNFEFGASKIASGAF